MNLLHRPFVLVFLVITGTAGLVLFSTIYIERERSYMHSPSVPFCTVCKAGMDENPYFFSVQYRSVFQHTHDALFRKKNGQKK